MRPEMNRARDTTREPDRTKVNPKDRPPKGSILEEKRTDHHQVLCIR